MLKQLSVLFFAAALIASTYSTAVEQVASSSVNLQSDSSSSDDGWDDDWDDEENITGTQVSGFIEARSGSRLQSDRYQSNTSINELRVKTVLEKSFDYFDVKFNADFIADSVVDHQSLNLQKGQGFLDLRELYINASPLDNLDLKIGRQIMTWGTGDLVFINDLFSKDWRSFFNGRDSQYLKAPSDAIKASVYLDQLNLDLVYIPKFNSDRFINGERLSYQNSTNQPMMANLPDHSDELSARVYQSFGAAEVAAYLYKGHAKSPAGFNQQSAKAIFPELSVYGASIRAPFAKGIINGEIGYRDISTPRQPQLSYSKGDEWRALIGYEQEIAKELTAAFQYYIEIKKERADRQVTTVRLTKQLMQQKIQLSMFNFYSPNEQDGYLRLNGSYKYSDDLKLELGSNQFYGHDNKGFFSQFKNNNNLYAALKFSF